MVYPLKTLLQLLTFGPPDMDTLDEGNLDYLFSITFTMSAILQVTIAFIGIFTKKKHWSCWALIDYP
jgi:hypothetical protein